MPELDFSVNTSELKGNAFVVTVAGEADMHTAPELEQALEGVVAAGGTSVVLDLSEVTFMDSTVLSVLIRHDETFKRLGGKLVVVSNDRGLLRTFEITGLERILTIESKLAAAIGLVNLGTSRLAPEG